MIAGNIGSDAIMSYTVIGDAVNLGSRLESLNKQYGTRIIISDATRQRLSRPYRLRPLGDVVVKGKTQPVAIFEVIGRPRVNSRGTRMKQAIDRCGDAGARRAGARAVRRIDQALKKAQQVKDAKDKFDDLNVTEDRKSGRLARTSAPRSASASASCRTRPVHKYVTLVGIDARASESERPNLAWTFIVLDTDGVNAFASPGGIVHITRGALGLITSEAELAGVLAHEIGHVAHKHTVNAIKKNKAVQLGTNETLSSRGTFLDKHREQGLRDGAREQVRPRRRDGRRQGVGHADREGRLRAGHAGGVPHAPRRAQQGSAGAERPVRVASRDEGADRRDQEARRREDRRDRRGALQGERQVRADAGHGDRAGRRRRRRGSRDRPRPRTRKKSRRKKRPRRRSRRRASDSAR